MTRSRAPDADTLFEIGSASKVFTSVLLAEEERRGLVHLDEPVRDLLPKDVLVPEQAGHPITLWNLATHTSGLPRMPTNFAPKDPATPYADYRVEELYAFLASYSPSRAPGERYDYSNLGVGLLGHALSLRAQQSYESMVVEWIAKPLGMTSTTLTVSAENQARFASGHASDGDPTPAFPFAVLAPAGGIRSSAADMLRFVQANLGQVDASISPALRRTHAPQFDLPGGGKICLAWHMPKSQAFLWHNGQTGGYHSYLAFDAAKQVGVVVLSNSATMTVDSLGVALMAMLRGEAWKLELPAVARVSEGVLERYVGQYELTPTFSFSVTRRGPRLMMQATNQLPLRLWPVSETEFQYRAVAARVSFSLEEGRVSGLVLHQNGKDMPARKVK